MSYSNQPCRRGIVNRESVCRCAKDAEIKTIKFRLLAKDNTRSCGGGPALDTASLRTAQGTHAATYAGLAPFVGAGSAWFARAGGVVTCKSHHSALCVGISHVGRCCLLLVRGCFFLLQLAHEGDLLLGGEFLLRGQGGNGLNRKVEVVS